MYMVRRSTFDFSGAGRINNLANRSATIPLAAENFSRLGRECFMLIFGEARYLSFVKTGRPRTEECLPDPRRVVQQHTERFEIAESVGSFRMTDDGAHENERHRI